MLHTLLLFFTKHVTCIDPSPKKNVRCIDS